MTSTILIPKNFSLIGPANRSALFVFGHDFSRDLFVISASGSIVAANDDRDFPRFVWNDERDSVIDCEDGSTIATLDDQA